MLSYKLYKRKRVNTNKIDKCNKQVSLQRHINYVDNIRDNLNSYNGDMTLPEIAESAGIPFSTLKNILYGNSADCKLSTAASFAKFLGITIDELVGTDTLTEDAKESLSIYRELPERSKYLARWFVKHQKSLCSNNDSTKSVAVMIPKDANGYLHPTNEFKTLSIDDFSDYVKAKAFIGIRIIGDYYMPYYSPYDTLLIANDRKPFKNEHCVILYYGKIKIVTRKEHSFNGSKIVEYIPIRNRKAIIDESEIDELIGYVVDVYKDYSD